jgi:hypothetical protein
LLAGLLLALWLVLPYIALVQRRREDDADTPAEPADPARD